MSALILAVEMITLYSIDGRAILVNPQQVTQMREARPEGDARKQFNDKVNCGIRLTDGSYVTVAEDCAAVRKLMEGEGP